MLLEPTITETLTMKLNGMVEALREPEQRGGVVRLRRTPTESEHIAALTPIGHSVPHIQITSVASLRGCPAWPD